MREAEKIVRELVESVGETTKSEETVDDRGIESVRLIEVRG